MDKDFADKLQAHIGEFIKYQGKSPMTVQVKWSETIAMVIIEKTKSNGNASEDEGN